MALVFMLNPANKPKKKRATRKKPRAKTRRQNMARGTLPKSYIKRWGISKKAWSEYRKAKGGGRKRNPPKRRRRRNLSQGKVRPKRFHKRKTKARNYCRQYTRTRSKTKNRRGWVCNKKVTKRQAFAHRRNNPKRSNAMARRNRKGQFVKTRRRRRRNPVTARRSNPRRTNARKRRRRRNPVARRANPRRRNPRRRNPMFGGALATIKRSLTSPSVLIEFGVGALSAGVCSTYGNKLADYVIPMLPAGLVTHGSLGHKLVRGAFTIALGAGISTVVPAKYKKPVLLGAGIGALAPVVEGALKSAGLAGLGSMGAWLTARDLQRASLRGHNGMGGWLTTGDARRFGVTA